MTYIVEKPAASVTGIERPLITIEFALDIHPAETEYSYPHPKFVFGDRVIATDLFPSLEYTVCALELIQSKTTSGRLLNQPYWKYKLDNGEVYFWKEESALLRSVEQQSLLSCSTKCDRLHPEFQIGNVVKVPIRESDNRSR